MMLNGLLLVVLLITTDIVASFPPIALPLFAKPQNDRQDQPFQPPKLVADHTWKGSVLCMRQKRFSDDSDFTSKGIVYTLTNLVNSIFDTRSFFLRQNSTAQLSSYDAIAGSNILQAASAPSSAQELLERIREDYTTKNYLWTGDLDLNSNFDSSCRFKDPTLSFIGTNQYIKNIQNLRPIVNVLTNVDECRSDLLDIQLHENFIQTRWNMVGTLTAFPWQPRIDVIGQTKIWYHNDTYKIYFYDEIWEIPAGRALLQLITPAGTIPNTSMVRKTP
jgi:Uncharacterized conserved protein (DUF2358)